MLGDLRSWALTRSALVVVALLTVGCGGATDAASDGGGPESDGQVSSREAGVDAAADGAAVSDGGGLESDGQVSSREAGADAAADDAADSRRIIFLTSVSYSAALGGLAGGDARCQALAAAAGLPGVFKAWLSDANTAARDRLTHADVPYELVDGTVVASDWKQLASGLMLTNPISVTETGGSAPGQPGAVCYPTVWTNTDPYGGIESTGDCTAWTNTSDAGEGTWLGASGSTDPTWTAECFDNGACSFVAPLYCLEQ
jgi:hypothetical protein